MMRKASTLLAMVVVIAMLTACGGGSTSKSSKSDIAAKTAVSTAATPPPTSGAATPAATPSLATAATPPAPAATPTTAPVPTLVPTKAPTPTPSPVQAVAPAQAADVPLSRGNAARTGEQPGPGPARSSQVVWRFKSGGAVVTDPVLAGGVIYFSSDDFALYAVDAATRLQRWRFVPQSPGSRSIPDGARETARPLSAPAVASGAVYVGDIYGMIHRLDAATGKEQWSFQTGGPVNSSPVVVNGAVIAGSLDGAVYALDATTGEQRWQFMTRDGVTASPAVAGETIYIGSRDGSVYALDTATGDQRWAVSTGRPIVSAVAVANGTVYAANQGGGLFALDGGTGEEHWRFATGDQRGLAPAADKDGVYVAARDASGGLTGDATLIATLQATYVATIPAFVTGATNNGSLVALNGADGTLRWRFAARGEIASAPVIAGDMVYAGGADGSLYAVDKATGETRWTQAIGGTVTSSPAVSGGTAYLGAGDNFLLALREGPNRASQATSAIVPTGHGDVAGTGIMPGPGIEGQPALAWRLEGAGSAPVAANGMLYYPEWADDHWIIHAVNKATGKERWRANIAGDRSSDAPLMSVDGPTVYVTEFNEDRDLSALVTLDATSGARIRTIGLVASVGSLVVHRGTVYLTSGLAIAAIDTATGAQRWLYLGARNTYVYGVSVSNDAVVAGILIEASDGTRGSGVLALDALTGKQRWQSAATPADSFIAPVIDGSVVYAGDGAGTLASFDLATGTQRWRATITRNKAAISGVAAFKGTLYVAGLDGFLYAVDAASGKAQWTFEGGFAFDTPPTVADGLVYAGNRDNNVYAVDATTGKEAWRFRADGDITAPPAVVDQAVYATSWHTLYAIRGGAGGAAAAASTPSAAPQAQSQGRTWLVESGESFGDPVVVGDTAYARSGDSVYAVDTATGTVRWRWKAHTGDSGGDAQFIVTPSKTVVLKLGNTVFALDAGTGSQRWQAPFDHLYRFVGGGTSVFALGERDGAFALFALNEQTGAPEWQGDVGENRNDNHPPVVQGDTVVVAVGLWIYAFDTPTGKERWHTIVSAVSNNQSISGVTVDGSNVYVNGLLGQTVAYDIHTGKERWRFYKVDGGQADKPLRVLLAVDRVVAQNDRSLSLVDPVTGAMVWTLDLRNIDGSSFIAADGGDAVYLEIKDYSSMRKIVRVDARTGAIAWAVALGDGLRVSADASAVAVDSRLYVPVTGLDDDRALLLVVDAATGVAQWQAQPGWIYGTPMVSGDMIYAGTSDALVAYKVESGQITGTPAAAKATAPAATVTAGKVATTTLIASPPAVATTPAVGATGSGSGMASTGPTPTQLKALLPDQSVMPNGLTWVTDNERSLADVVTALGDSPSVEANLKQWGWTGNVERSFAAPDPTQLPAGATTNIVVSVHGFGSATGAKDALKLYADYLATQGYQEVRAPQVGDSARMLQATASDGTMNVALYAQEGNVLYRIAGSASGGDPTTNIVKIAQATLPTTLATVFATTAPPPAADRIGSFAAGDTVTTTDSVNLRDSPSSTGNVLTVLNAGDSLTIVSGPEAGDNYQWYQVKTADGTEGWLSSDFMQKK